MKDILRSNSFAAIGYSVKESFDTAVAFAPFLGNLLISLMKLITHPKKLNYPMFGWALTKYGPNSFVIILISNLLFGTLTSAVVGTYLTAFKTQILVVNIIYSSVTRDITPILIGVLMLLRTGVTATTSTYLSSHIKFHNTASEAIWPRMFALCIIMPLQYIYAASIGIIASAILANNLLNITYPRFFGRLQEIMKFSDFYIGITTTLLFGIEIILISSFYGWYYKRKALSVGKAVRSMLIIGLITLFATNTYLEFILRKAGI